GNRKRRNHTRERRSVGNSQGDAYQWRRDAQYPAKSILRVYLQRARRADRSRRTLSLLRTPPQSDDCRRCHEFQLRFSYRECAATAILQIVNELRPPIEM